MDATHFHLVITHLPIFGAALGMLILIFAMWRKSATTKMAAYGMFVISAVGAGIAYATGEGAEEKVEDLPGVMESIISRHEEFAMYALISMIVLGTASLIAMIVNGRANILSKTSAMVVLFLSLVSFWLVAKTGQLGGQIRHTEVRSGALQNAAGDGGGEQGDND